MHTYQDVHSEKLRVNQIVALTSAAWNGFYGSDLGGGGSNWDDSTNPDLSSSDSDSDGGNSLADYGADDYGADDVGEIDDEDDSSDNDSSDSDDPDAAALARALSNGGLTGLIAAHGMGDIAHTAALDQLRDDWYGFGTAWNSFFSSGTSGQAGDPDELEWSTLIQYESQLQDLQARMVTAGVPGVPPVNPPGWAGLMNLYPGIPYGEALTTATYVAGAAALFFVVGPFLSDLFGTAGGFVSAGGRVATAKAGRYAR